MRRVEQVRPTSSKPIKNHNAIRRIRSRWVRNMAAASITAVVLGLAGSAPISANAAATSGSTTPRIALMLNDKLVYQVHGTTQHGRVYLPVWYMMQLLRKAGVPNRWTGTEWGIAVGGRLVMPVFHPSNPEQKAIVIQDKIIARVASVGMANATCLPETTFAQALHSVSVSFTWNGNTFSVTSAKHQSGSGSGSTSKSPSGSGGTSVTGSVYGTGNTQPLVYTFADTYNGRTLSLADLTTHASSLNDVAVFDSSTLTASGAVSGAIPGDENTLMTGQQKPSIQLTISNLTSNGFDTSLMKTVFRSPQSVQTLASHIAEVAAHTHVSGMNVDFEQIPPTYRAEFTTFLSTLDSLLHKEGVVLVVDVPAETGNTKLEAYDGAYDYRSIGQHCDDVMVMAYDYSYPGGPPGAIAPIAWVNQVTKYTVSQVPAKKVLLGVPTYAYDWVGSKTSAYSLSEAENRAKLLKVPVKWDAASEAPYYTYHDSSGDHTVYYENSASLAAKLSIAEEYHCAGIAFWRAGLESPSFWSLIQAYKAGTLRVPNS